MDKKKIFAIALFFIMGFFVFTFANPKEETKKLGDKPENEIKGEEVKTQDDVVEEPTVLDNTVVIPVVAPIVDTTPVIEDDTTSTIGEDTTPTIEVTPEPTLEENDEEQEEIDTTKPVIDLNGGDIIIRTTDSYEELGATATDDKDGDITDKIVITGNVDNEKGTYTIDYDVTDSSGNAADTVTRTVNVVDVTDLQEDIEDGNSILEETEDREVSRELEDLLDELKEEIDNGEELIEDEDSLQDVIDEKENDIEEIIEQIRNLEFKVSFVEYNKTTDRFVKYNQTVSDVPEPSNKPGYEFNNWDGNYSNVMKDETVTAIYNLLTFEVTYNTDGEHSNKTSFTVEDDDLDLTIPTKDGYTCSTWMSGSNEYTSLEGVVEDIELTSICSANDNSYTVKTYYQTSGSNYSLDATYTKTGKTDSTIDINALKGEFLKAHYSFSKVEKNSDTINADGNTLIKIYYNKISYKVEFMNGDLLHDTQLIFYNDSASTPENPTKDGYIFKEWDKPYNNITSDLIIYAMYDANKATANIAQAAIEGKKHAEPNDTVTYTLSLSSDGLVAEFDTYVVEPADGLTITCTIDVANHINCVDGKINWTPTSIDEKLVINGTINSDVKANTDLTTNVTVNGTSVANITTKVEVPVSVISSELKQEDLDIVLVLDRSNSMKDYIDCKNYYYYSSSHNCSTKLDAMKKSAKQLVTDLVNNNNNGKVSLSIIPFAKEAISDYADYPELDKNNLNEALNKIEKISISPSTYLYRAAKAGYNKLKKTNDSKKFLVILSDGEPTSNVDNDIVNTIRDDSNIKVYAIGLGIDNNITAQNALKEFLNDSTHYFSANNAATLNDAFQAISEDTLTNIQSEDGKITVSNVGATSIELTIGSTINSITDLSETNLNNYNITISGTNYVWDVSSYAGNQAFKIKINY